MKSQVNSLKIPSFTKILRNSLAIREATCRFLVIILCFHFPLYHGYVFSKKQSDETNMQVVALSNNPIVQCQLCFVREPLLSRNLLLSCWSSFIWYCKSVFTYCHCDPKVLHLVSVMLSHINEVIGIPFN